MSVRRRGTAPWWSRVAAHPAAPWIVFFVALAVISGAAGPGAQAGGDTPLYFHPDAASRFELVSFTGGHSRPWVVTLPFAILGSMPAIAFFQHVVSLVGWSLLLWAVWKVDVSALLRHVASGALVVLGAGASVASWNLVVQSESISVSGVAFFVAGTLLVLSGRSSARARAVGAVALVGGLLLAALVRPFIVVAVGPLVVGLAVSASRSSARSRRRFAAVVSAACVVTAAYCVAVNERMNESWGFEFSGVHDIRGRSMQQIQVLYQLEWTRAYIDHRAAGLTSDPVCVRDGLRSGTYWPQIARKCPEGVREMANGFEIDFLRHVLTTPSAWRALRPPFSEAFAAFPLPNAWVDPIPIPLTWMLYAPSLSAVNPLVFALAGCGALLFALGRRRSSGRWADVAVFVLAPVAGVVAVAVNVLLSPIDSARVSIALTTFTRIGFILAVIVAVDAWQGARQPLPEPGADHQLASRSTAAERNQ